MTEPGTGWQSMATAPRDGTMVRLQRIYRGALIAEGCGFFGAVMVDYDEGPDTYEHCWVSEDRRHFFPEPTRWKPLPEVGHD